MTRHNPDSAPTPQPGLLRARPAGLLPTILVGPLLGAAVVYGIGQNDLFAIRYKLFPPKQSPMRN